MSSIFNATLYERPYRHPISQQILEPWARPRSYAFLALSALLLDNLILSGHKKSPRPVHSPLPRP